jgi:hypothetical protein
MSRWFALAETFAQGGGVIALDAGLLALAATYGNTTTPQLLFCGVAFALVGLCAAAWVPARLSAQINGQGRLAKAFWCVPIVLLLPAIVLSAAGFVAEMLEISLAMAIAVSCIFVFGACLCVLPLVLRWWVERRFRRVNDTGDV